MHLYYNLQYATVQFDKVHAKRLLGDPKWDFRCLTCNGVFFYLDGWLILFVNFSFRFLFFTSVAEHLAVELSLPVVSYMGYPY